MFQSLRQNSQVYIFHKGNTPELEIGMVVSTPIVHPKYPIPQQFGQSQEMVVDLTVKVNNTTVNYNGLPAQLDIADSFTNGETVVLADNREAINSEVLSFKQKSEDTLNSIDRHREIIRGCENILDRLNPEYAQKRQQQDKITNLKSQMDDVSKTLAVLTEMVGTLTKKED